MVQCVVNYDPAVVRGIAPFVRLDRLHAGGVVMRIAQGRMKTGRIDISRNTFGAHIQHLERGSINIFVNDDHALLGGLDNLLKKDSGYKELALEEHLLHRRERGADEEIHLFLQFVNLLGMFLQPAVDSILNSNETIIYCITTKYILF